MAGAFHKSGNVAQFSCLWGRNFEAVEREVDRLELSLLYVIAEK